MADTERLKKTMQVVITGMMAEMAASIEASGPSQTDVPHAQDPLWAALIPARVSREVDLAACRRGILCGPVAIKRQYHVSVLYV